MIYSISFHGYQIQLNTLGLAHFPDDEGSDDPRNLDLPSSQPTEGGCQPEGSLLQKNLTLLHNRIDYSTEY
jgi:hypothetical protein